MSDRYQPGNSIFADFARASAQLRDMQQAMDSGPRFSRRVPVSRLQAGQQYRLSDRLSDLYTYDPAPAPYLDPPDTDPRDFTDPMPTIDLGNTPFRVTWNTPAVEPEALHTPSPAEATSEPTRDYPTSYVTFADDFRETLYEMQTQSRIAEKLLAYGTTHVEEINFVTRAAKGMLSYLPKGRTHLEMRNGQWDPRGRQSGKPARVARMLLQPSTIKQLTDKDFELFNNLIRARDVNAHATFSRVTGQDIAHWYHESQYEDSQASLSSSCMRYTEAQPYLCIYTDNPDQVSMVILVNDKTGRLLGRALVWTIEGLDACFMDRVYGTDITQEMFRTYANEQGWYSRERNSFDYPTSWMKDGEAIERRISFFLPNYRFAYFPYMDTFKWLDRRDGEMTNYEERGRTKLASVDGEGAPSDWSRYPVLTTERNADGATVDEEVDDDLSMEPVPPEGEDYTPNYVPGCDCPSCREHREWLARQSPADEPQIAAPVTPPWGNY